MKFFSKIVLLSISLFIPIICIFVPFQTEQRDRKLSIYLDGSESGTGPITHEFLANISRESNPILVSDVLFEQFITRKNRFKNNRKSHKQRKILDAINANIKSGRSLEWINNHYDCGSLNFDTADTCAYITAFDTQRWEVRKHGHQYLLVPKSYLVQLNCCAGQQRDSSGDVTDCEYKLGLRIDHLQVVTQKNLDAIKTYPSGSDGGKNLVNSLDAFFVIKKDYKKSCCRSSVPHWKFFVLGHGQHARKSALKKVKPLVPLLAGPLRVVETVGNFLTGQSSQVQGQDNVHSDSEWNVPRGTCVAGMDLALFREMLLFFDNKIKTDFLYFDTCFGGGYNLEQVLRTVDGAAYYNYSFPIACGTTFDAVTFGRATTFALPPNLQECHINRKVGCLQTKVTNHTFNVAFSTISNTYLPELTRAFEPYYRAWHDDRYYGDTGNNTFPSIKYPHVDTLFVLADRVRHVTIDEAFLLVNRGRDIVIDGAIETVTLKTENIDDALIIKKKIGNDASGDACGKLLGLPIKIASQIPGDACHTIKSLHAQTNDIDDVVELFDHIECSAARKKFLIKNVYLLDRIYHNVKIECVPHYRGEFDCASSHWNVDYGLCELLGLKNDQQKVLSTIH